MLFVYTRKYSTHNTPKIHVQFPSACLPGDDMFTWTLALVRLSGQTILRALNLVMVQYTLSFQMTLVSIN